MIDDYYTPDELAKLTGLSTSTICRDIQMGKLMNSSGWKRKKFIPWNGVLDWLRERRSSVGLTSESRQFLGALEASVRAAKAL